MDTTAADDDCSSQQRRQQRVKPSQQERGSAKAVAAMEGPVTEKARGHSGICRDFGLLRWMKSMAKKRRMLCPRSMRYKF
jgi:hypothetical protein